VTGPMNAVERGPLRIARVVGTGVGNDKTAGTLILPAHFPRPGYTVRAAGGHRVVTADAGQVAA
jgi:hypothetical protein